MAFNSTLSEISDDSPPQAVAHPSATYLLYRPWRRYLFLAVLFLVTTSNYFDYFILSVVLDPIKREFQVSDTMLGLLSGFCFALIYAIAGFPIARWADRGNRSRIITLALSAWSVITLCCGIAQSFWQLAAARFGLGLVEPGALPPAQSLIADYFPPERRATALSILTTSSAAGYLFGIAVGGYIAASYGWRAAFLVAGVPGIALAIATGLILPEPRFKIGFPSATHESENLKQTIVSLLRKRAFVLTVVGISVYCIFAYGANIFLPSYMIRTLHVTLTQVSVTWGSAISAANIIGGVAGGRLADHLRLRDIRWYAWLPAISCAAAIPLYWSALEASTFPIFVVMDFLAESTVAAGVPVAFATLQFVCGSNRRATAVAVAQFSLTLVGAGLGPLLAGFLSDTFALVHGREGLRYSLITLVLSLAPAAFAFYRSGFSIIQNTEE